MAHLTRRRFLGTAAALAAGLTGSSRSIFAALAAPSCPRRVVKGEANGFVSFLVVDAGVGLDPRCIPDKYHTGVHICFPPSHRPCWCGGWHAPEDPADFVIVAGPHAGIWRFAQDRPGLAVLPSDLSPHPDLSTLGVAPVDLYLTTTRIMEHVAEGLLMPGLVGYSFPDVCELIGRGRQLHFSYATSAAGLLHTTELMIAAASGWHSRANHLIFRQTWDARMQLADIAAAYDWVIAGCHGAASSLTYATVDLGSSLALAALLGAC